MPPKPFRSFYAVLPANVRHHPKISASAKLLYAEVMSMLNEEATCAAPNECFTQLFGCDERTVERWFKELRGAGLLFTACDKTPNGSIRYASFTEISLTACREKWQATNLTPALVLYNKGKPDGLLRGSGSENGSKNPPDIQGTLLPDDAKKPDAIDYGKILAMYHELCPSLPRIRTLNDVRKAQIRARHKEAGGKLETFSELFAKANASKFLKGETGGKWSADFDFLLSPKGFTKTLEGRYDDQEAKPRRINSDETPDFTS